jgi:hypothetical protein
VATASLIVLSSINPMLPTPPQCFVVKTGAMTIPGEGEAKDDAPPARLMIKKMVLENFKSYAGAKEIGPLHKVSKGSLALCGAWD